MRSPLRLASAAILSLLCAISVFAQASQTGGITGVVTDSGGALVAGATLAIATLPLARPWLHRSHREESLLLLPALARR